jgi:hypothetical protein
MARKLEVAPQYFSELSRFIREPSFHVRSLTDQKAELDYAPWTAFATGTAIFASFLAIDAARSLIHFDRIVLLTMIIVSAFGFAVLFHAVARLALGGKASFLQVLCGSEYLIGFLVPLLAGGVFVVTSLASRSPGLDCSLGYFRVHSRMDVPTAGNQLLLSIVYLAAGVAAVYGIFRSFRFLRELESLSAWRTSIAIAISGLAIVLIQGQLEVYARLFSGQLKNLGAILTGS